MRTCSRCGIEKSLDEFSRDSTKPEGRRYSCRPCAAQRQRERYAEQQPARRSYFNAKYRSNPEPVRARSRAWYAANKERKREQNYQRAYGLSVADVEAMAKSQRHLCALCSKKAPLVVDHNHETGQVRGMLCHRCNLLLGVVEKVGLVKVTRYLEQAISNAQAKKSKKK